MSSYDITFCSKQNCKNKECERSQRRIIQECAELNYIPYISISDFKECEYWEEEVEQQKSQRKTLL